MANVAQIGTALGAIGLLGAGILAYRYFTRKHKRRSSQPTNEEYGLLGGLANEPAILAAHRQTKRNGTANRATRHTSGRRSPPRNVRNRQQVLNAFNNLPNNVAKRLGVRGVHNPHSSHPRRRSTRRKPGTLMRGSRNTNNNNNNNNN